MVVGAERVERGWHPIQVQFKSEIQLYVIRQFTDVVAD